MPSDDRSPRTLPIARRPQFFRETASTVSSNGLVLLLAQIMGMYFLSSVLLMRMNLPEEYRYAVMPTWSGAREAARR